MVLEFDLTIFDGVTAHADLGQLLLYGKILPSFVLNLVLFNF